MKRFLCVFGTRPEIIKLAPVIQTLQTQRGAKVFTCDTGQHREMSGPLLKWFGIRPNFQLRLMAANQSLSQLMARAVLKLDQVMARTKPDIVICQGDTTTATATALAAFHHKIPVAHVEAGLRTYDFSYPWPEEMNRQIIDLLAHYHFTPTPIAKKNLLSEGAFAQRVWITGNTGIDSLFWTLDKIKRSPPKSSTWPTSLRALVSSIRGKQARPFVLVTAHRRENFGRGLRQITKAIRMLSKRFPYLDWIFPVHLNPNVRQVVHQNLKSLKHVKLTEPLNYPQFCWLFEQSMFVLTDSGGIQEEAPCLGKPVLVLRVVTERPEVVKAGVAKAVGNSTKNIVQEVERLLTEPQVYRRMSKKMNLYGDGKAALRISKVLLRGSK
jgi:UDP-N-acetylglucosamine 2-epimerase (non-hydrolysing)